MAGPDTDVIRWLVEERRILGFGTETIGTDAGQAGHVVPLYPAPPLSPRRRPLRAALSRPFKIKHGSGSPLRVLALFDGKA